MLSGSFPDEIQRSGMNDSGEGNISGLLWISKALMPTGVPGGISNDIDLWAGGAAPCLVAFVDAEYRSDILYISGVYGIRCSRVVTPYERRRPSCTTALYSLMLDIVKIIYIYGWRRRIR